MSLNVNLNDPRVKTLLDEDGQVVRPGSSKKAIVRLAGDAVDPTGVTSHRGIESTQRLDGAKQICSVVFKDTVLEVDVYAIPGSPLELIFMCPRCRKQSRITQEMKAIEFEQGSTRPVRLPDGQTVAYGRPLRLADGHLLQNAGTLSVEPFQCSWELPDANAHTPGIRAGGLTLCRLKLVIDQNVAREA